MTVRHVMQHFLMPLRSKHTTQEETVCVVDIFSNIELIARMHKDLYRGLEELQEDWPLVCGVGQLFLAMVRRLHRPRWCMCSIKPRLTNGRMVNGVAP